MCAGVLERRDEAAKDDRLRAGVGELDQGLNLLCGSFVFNAMLETARVVASAVDSYGSL